MSKASDDFPTAQPGDHHQLVARDVQREVLEVVLTRPAYPDEFFAHGPEFRQLNNRQAYGNPGIAKCRILIGPTLIPLLATTAPNLQLELRLYT